MNNLAELNMEPQEIFPMDQLDTEQFVNESGIAPLGHAVLVQTYEPEITSSVIALPNAVTERMAMVEQRCIVVAIGPAAWQDEKQARAKPGDRVLVTKFAGWLTTQTKDGKPYRLVNDRDIFARLDWEQVR
jgi:co-chaperonin GroES (HSP10)